MQTKLHRLLKVLAAYPKLNIAVSGGVDSMLLSYVAHQIDTIEVTAVHACSYAVPEQAFSRVKTYAQRHQWHLKLINAGELEDPEYINNPVNRCYFCKSNLYQRISENTEGVIASGTNLDDLSDFRPGLAAAKENRVVHPYVEAKFTKQDIYQLASFFELNDLESLPAQPCLASRVETGIQINPEDLLFIDKAESLARKLMPNVVDLRCRITHQGVYLELSQLPTTQIEIKVTAELNLLCIKHGKLFSGIRLYKKGSAFITEGQYYEAI
ncbi:hypothetical protein XM47_18130 [Catenovulum maritimum]|uniref:Uncharacterized protein n=1 Tax=Catenovulum maritimum TaxID=1513271 RepID=A0A0J8GLQ5_9ALTE|nr:hypothetical protein XM47_18130 [Catenovulum maritimum]